jgi:hypothetical protein
MARKSTKSTKIPGVIEVDDIPITDEDASDSDVKVILVDKMGLIGLVVRGQQIEVWQRIIHKESGKTGFGKWKKGDFSNWQLSRTRYYSNPLSALKDCLNIAIRNRIAEDDIKDLRDVCSVIEKCEELLDFEVFDLLQSRKK